MKIIKQGTVKVFKAFTVNRFDEDDGTVEIQISPGIYKYRVLDINGWKPRQILVRPEGNEQWVDVCDNCADLEALLDVEFYLDSFKSDADKKSKYVIVSTWVGEEGQAEAFRTDFGGYKDAVRGCFLLWYRSMQEASSDLTFDPDNTLFDKESGCGSVCWSDNLKRDFEVIEVEELDLQYFW